MDVMTLSCNYLERFAGQTTPSSLERFFLESGPF